jgi:2-polyprenyl-3-methyl-5-hydroxy-6-metoxy-1,4-benzoquinol methylase
MKQFVKDYGVIAPLPQGNFAFHGDSAAEKRLVFHLFPDAAQREVRVLDIGFGRGTLGQLIKSQPQTAHWQVDGVDGFEVACWNAELFERRHYRHIWHGYAQDLPPEQLAEYDVLCLLDVIEHLDAQQARALLKTLLSSLRDDAVLVLSTPLWFYPQDSNQAGDLEEHKIGVPASSMMALQPLMYAMGPALVGTFAYRRSSLDYVDLFHPVEDKGFTLDRGARVATAVGMQLKPGVVYKTGRH